MYSDYINIDTQYNSNIFYWLILNNSTQQLKPLIISLSGEAGKSSLFSLFSDNGPLKLSDKDKAKIDIEKSWSSIANLLYVDFPVGTGYSFTDNKEKIPIGELDINTQFYYFLQKFYETYRDLIKNEIFIVGDNFNGKYIPALTRFILEKNELIKKQEFLGSILNIKKIGLGNSLLDTSYQLPARRHLAKGIGLMSEFDDENQFDFLVQKCDFASIKKSDKALEHCSRVLDYLQDLGGDIFEFDVRRTMDKDKNLIKIINDYLNQESVIEALNIKNKAKKTPYWSLKNDTVVDSLKFYYASYSSVRNLEYLLNMTFPVFIYSGQFDLSYGPNGLQLMLNSINFTNSNNFNYSPRKLWYVQKNNKWETGGSVKYYDSLTFVTVKSAGQYITRDNPIASLDLISKFISDTNSNTLWSCPKDVDCSLTVKKCSKMNYCSGNGECNDLNGGLCNCTEGFYGGDCSMRVANLTTGQIKILPKDVQVYKVVNYFDNILLEIDSDDKNIEVSLLDKREKEHLFNPEKHAVTYKLVTHKLILYIEKELLDNCVIVIRNLELLHEIKLNVFINYYSIIL